MMKFKREGPVRANCGLNFEVAHIHVFVTTVYMNFPIKGSKLGLKCKNTIFWGQKWVLPLLSFSRVFLTTIWFTGGRGIGWHQIFVLNRYRIVQTFLYKFGHNNNRDTVCFCRFAQVCYSFTASCFKGINDNCIYDR